MFIQKGNKIAFFTIKVHVHFTRTFSAQPSPLEFTNNKMMIIYSVLLVWNKVE